MPKSTTSKFLKSALIFSGLSSDCSEIGSNESFYFQNQFVSTIKPCFWSTQYKNNVDKCSFCKHSFNFSAIRIWTTIALNWINWNKNNYIAKPLHPQRRYSYMINTGLFVSIKNVIMQHITSSMYNHWYQMLVGRIDLQESFVMAHQPNTDFISRLKSGFNLTHFIRGG